MTEALPSNMSFGMLHGRFGTGLLLYGDADHYPDFEPAAGLIVTITPTSLTFIAHGTAEPSPLTLIMKPIRCTIDPTTGYMLGPDGTEGVYLIATDDPDIEPHNNWTYDVRYSGVDGDRLKRHTITVPSGSDRWITNLADLPGVPGVSLTQVQLALIEVDAAVAVAASSAADAAADAVTATAQAVAADASADIAAAAAATLTTTLPAIVTAAVAASNAGKADKVNFGSRPGAGTFTDGSVVTVGLKAIAQRPDIGTAYIQGGAINRENVIGGNTANVNTAVSNLTGAPTLTDEDGNWSAILHGYDNVNNGWACIVSGYHNAVEAGANHGTVSGGSAQTIAADVAYATIAGGTQGAIGAGATGAVISGGNSNTVNGLQSVISGGNGNTANGQQSVVSGGNANTAPGKYGVIGGGSGNTASGDQSVVGGGITNTANSASSTVSGGLTNNATAATATIGGGQTNTASGIAATIPGGKDNIASGAQSLASGRGANAYSPGMRAHSGSFFTVAGDAQEAKWVLRKATTDAVATQLYTDGLGTYLTVPVSSAMVFDAFLVARQEATGDAKAIHLRGTVKRGATGAASLVGTLVNEVVGNDTGAATWSVALAFGATDGSLRFAVTGEAAKSIRWVLTVTGTQVAG